MVAQLSNPKNGIEARRSCSKLYDAMSGHLHVLFQCCGHPCLFTFTEGEKFDPLDRVTLLDAFTWLCKQKDSSTARVTLVEN